MNKKVSRSVPNQGMRVARSLDSLKAAQCALQERYSHFVSFLQNVVKTFPRLKISCIFIMARLDTFLPVNFEAKLHFYETLYGSF